MADRADELAIYRQAVSTYIETLDGRERSRLLRQLALRIRRSQQTRIKAQMAPDGAPWPKRKPRQTQKAASRPIRFLYRKASGEERVADMRSWVRQGDRLTGFDREADGLRTFLNSRIARHLPAEGGADPGPIEGTLRTAKGRVRRSSQAMFVKLRQRISAGSNSDQAYVEFRGRAARLARIHHFGLKDRVVPGGPETDYPQRELLGFTQADEEAILAMLTAHMEGRV